MERVLAAVRPLAGPREPEAIAVIAREVVGDERERLRAGGAARTPRELAVEVVERLVRLGDPAIALPVAINATGVILHTNLGRAPWPAAAIEAARLAASGPSLLELDPATGRRGARVRAAEVHAVALTGAEDALVANNNAAAVTLAVALAGRGRGVAVSRGELVEIGGGVRIPEILRRAGVRLIEVGTTNRTRLADYSEALEAGRATLVLRVHPSNFRQLGFVEGTDLAALAVLAHERGAIVVDDLGSGALLDTARYGLTHEPMPAESLAAGADLVTFSGDKLLGGPQAGIVAGRADLVARIRRDPLARATRPDKVTLAALAATLGLYRAGLATAEIPVWRMIVAAPDELLRRAQRLIDATGSGTVVELVATVGGGSLPGETLASVGIALPGPAVALLARLRSGTPAVIGRVEDGRVVLDLRTVDPTADAVFAEAIRRAV